MEIVERIFAILGDVAAIVAAIVATILYAKNNEE